MAKKSLLVSPNFDVREFLHPTVFASLGWPKCLWVLDDRMWLCAELVREMIGSPVMVNNWHVGGDRVGRGHRPRNYFPEGGGKLSQHYLSRAVDVSSKRMSAPDLHRLILDNQKRFLDIGVTTIEDISFTRTWVHLDWRPLVKGINIPGQLLVVGK